MSSSGGARAQAPAPVLAVSPAPAQQAQRRPDHETGAAPARPVLRRSLATVPAQAAGPALAAAPARPTAASRPAVQRLCASCEEEQSTPRRTVEPEQDEDERRTEVQPSLEVGPVGDRYEQEADAIANRVMAMPASAASATATDASGATSAPVVQRLCSDCAQEEEQRARRRPAETTTGGGSGERIAASERQLTSGGSPLPTATRRYFEPRLGRDLSKVRVHRSGAASKMARSIRARAFTFRNHVWLGPGSSAAPSFTMAHELAHVAQQTAPGPVGPVVARRQGGDATPANPSVQPQRPFWMPMSSTGAGGLHTSIHNAAQKALRGRNTGKALMEEVPMPGAKSGKGNIGPDYVGFADLFISNNGNVPGLRQWNPTHDTLPPARSGAPAPAPPPVTNLTRDNTPFSGGPLIGRQFKRLATKTPASFNGYRQPRLNKSLRVYNLNLAPTSMWIGEVKPAHDPEYREFGNKHQLQNYVKGIKATAKATDQALVAQGSTRTWKVDVDLVSSSSLTLPDGWNAAGRPASATDWPIKSIKIRSSRKLTTVVGGVKKRSTKAINITPGGTRAKKGTAPVIRGRWSMAFDPDNAGLVVYYLMPHPDDLAKVLKSNASTRSFRATAKNLSQVLGPLMAIPDVKKRKARKRPLVRPLRLSKARARVQREAVDSFDRKLWEARRVGDPAMAKESEGNLAEQLAQTPAEEQEQIEQRGEMVEWLQAKRLPGEPASYRMKPGYEQLKKDAASLSKLRFWTSGPAAAFGRLREKLGGVFVTVMTKVEALREKLKAKFKDRDLSGGKKGTLYKAAAKVGALVLTAIGKPIARAVFNKVVQCAKSGFAAKVKTMVEGSGFEELQQKAEQIRKIADSYKEQATSYIDNLIKDALSPIEDEINILVSKGKAAAALFGTVAEIAKAARIGSCVAGLMTAPETVGIGAVVGCGAAVGDYILSKLGLSPIEYFIALTLESCDTKMKIARAMEKIDLVKKIPTIAAQKIVGGAKSLLRANLPQPFGKEAASLLCDPSSLKVDAPKISKSDICPHVHSPINTHGKSLVIPPGVYRYRKGDRRNDPAKEGKWQGWDEVVPPEMVAPPGSPGGGPTVVTSQSISTSPTGLVAGTQGYPEISKMSLLKSRYHNEKATVTLLLEAGGHVYQPFRIEVFIVEYPIRRDGKVYAKAHYTGPWSVTEKGMENGKPFSYTWGPLHPEKSYDHPVR